MYTLIRAAVVIFVVILAYLAGNTFAEPQSCCAHPNAEGISISEFAATWITPTISLLASLIALWLGTESWRREEREKNAFATKAEEAITSELISLVKAAKALESRGPLIRAMMGNEPIYGPSFVSARPFFEAIKPRIPDLPEHVVSAIYEEEGTFLQAEAALTQPNIHWETRDSQLRQFQFAGCQYIAALKQYGDNGIYEAMVDTGLLSKEEYSEGLEEGQKLYDKLNAIFFKKQTDQKEEATEPDNAENTLKSEN